MAQVRAVLVLGALRANPKQIRDGPAIWEAIGVLRGYAVARLDQHHALDPALGSTLEAALWLHVSAPPTSPLSVSNFALDWMMAHVMMSSAPSTNAFVRGPGAGAVRDEAVVRDAFGECVSLAGFAAALGQMVEFGLQNSFRAVTLWVDFVHVGDVEHLRACTFEQALEREGLGWGDFSLACRRLKGFLDAR